MDEDYTLVYYDFMGIGETIRFLFAIAQVPYKDVRLPYDCKAGHKKFFGLPPEWKERVPYEKLPMLLIGDGERKLVSSKPICRYLAAKFGLICDDPFDDAKCDEYMDSLRDFCDQLRPLNLAKDEDYRANVLARLNNYVIPRYVGKFDTIIAQNNGTNLVGNKLTWADVYIAHCLWHFSTILKLDFIQNYPAVTNLVNHVFSIPAIKNWVDVRPKSTW